MRKKLVVTILVLIFASGAGYWYWQTRPEPDSEAILVSGNIEVTEVQVSFRIPGRTAVRFVSEGEKIMKGQPVARLDDEEYSREVALSAAELAAAKALLAELLAGSRPQEIETAKAIASRAKAEAKRWKAEYKRQENLFRKNVIPARDFEIAQTAHQTAREKLREAREHLNLVKEGPRKEAIAHAQAQAERAKEALALAKTRLGFTILKSPLNGVVLSEHIESGEYVYPGTPVVTVGRLDKVWLRAYINETDLGRIKINQEVQVTIDTYPDKVYEGKISFISQEAEFTPKNVQTQAERVKLVYRIKVDISNPRQELKPGMPADGKIITTR
ncbi:MAG: efflux RND transporter periplasmic adaptor subunit [Proteobacteria bacterium]|nr:efflux RND transporter periplasmic adaptor subunit [Pseudomonadota bacterium]MCG2763228.1 efflux RND transporter periplasmic adaptor subunit [Desulfarculaceae bacterium]